MACEQSHGRRGPPLSFQLASSPAAGTPASRTDVPRRLAPWHDERCAAGGGGRAPPSHPGAAPSSTSLSHLRCSFVNVRSWLLEMIVQLRAGPVYRTSWLIEQ